MKRLWVPFALATLGILAVPATARETPCQPEICRATLTVKAKPVLWASPERFGSNATIQVVLRAGGRALDDEPFGRCRRHYYGSGLAVRVSVCRPRIRIRAVSVDARRRLRVLYTVLN